MRVVFFGTPDWAVPSLEALLGSPHEVAAVVTRPDRPSGRGRRLASCPVAARARDAGLSTLQPETLKDRAFRAAFHELGGEVSVVVAYGRIIPRSMLRAMTWVNVHFSLLPRWRGAAPVQRAILEGDATTGVTTMLMDEGLDTGDILLTRSTEIDRGDTSAELGARLASLGAPLLLETLAGLQAGTLQGQAQDPGRATLAPALTPDEAWLDWTATAVRIDRRVRALQPWPVARTAAGDRELHILEARPLAEGSPGRPGEIVAVDRDGVTVACGEGTALRLRRVRPAGRRVMSAAAAAAGRYLATGLRLSGPPEAGADRSV